jgi:hypothetical protein
VLLLTIASNCRGQSASANGGDTARRTLPVPPDSGTASASRSEAGVGDTTKFTMTKSPTMAILYSIIPGGGQIYNRQYWKAPLFFGAAVFFAWRVIYYHNLFLDTAAVIDALPSTVSSTDPQRLRLRAQREFYRDNRDLNAAYFLGVEILNMIDAYVGAHLFDFDVSDEVSSRIYLDPMRFGAGVSLRW